MALMPFFDGLWKTQKNETGALKTFQTEE